MRRCIPLFFRGWPVFISAEGGVSEDLVSRLDFSDVSRWNLQSPVTAVAREVYDLHTLAMIVCFLIFCLVSGVMFYSIFKHRKSRGFVPATFRENFLVEVVWTTIPLFIIIVLAVPAAKIVINMKDTSNPDLTVKVTGYQWLWRYTYLNGEGQGIEFFSNLKTPYDQINSVDVDAREKNLHYLLEVDRPLVVPVNKKIRIITTSNDVIHSWMVPAFGVKQDAIPGFVRDTWFKAEKVGIYRGQCAELCGKGHAFMPIVVEVKSAEDYASWVADQLIALPVLIKDSDDEPSFLDQSDSFESSGDAVLDTMETLYERGKIVYKNYCIACHQADGRGLEGTFPAISGSAVAKGPIDLHVDVLLKGRPGTSMASFRHLSDRDLAAVVTYQRNSWENKTGDFASSELIVRARSRE